MCDGAAAAGVDPVALLALLRAESGLNGKAERWGGRTAEAKAIIASGNYGPLQALVDDVWPDISFGFGQQIVLYHYSGSRLPNWENCLTVRSQSLGNPAENIRDAAHRLAGCFQHPSCDGSPLSAMTVYNAGSDRRSDLQWMASWRGNVESYKRSLHWAEGFRQTVL